MYKILRYKS